MKIRITDLFNEIQDESVELKIQSSGSADRIKTLTAEKIKAEHHKPEKHSPLKTLLIASVIAAALSTVTFAAVNFSLKHENVNGYTVAWKMLDENGELVYDEVTYPDAGLVLTFEGSKAEKDSIAQFKASYLPETENVTWYSKDGHGDGYDGQWAFYLSDEIGKTGPSVPFQISLSLACKQINHMVVSGDVEIASEERVDKLVHTEIFL